jgi:hypothetical protein
MSCKRHITETRKARSRAWRVFNLLFIFSSEYLFEWRELYDTFFLEICCFLMRYKIERFVRFCLDKSIDPRRKSWRV